MKTMSMLAVVFVLSVLFVACATPKFGSRQADNQVKVLEEEISLVQSEISDLKDDIKNFTISSQEKLALNQKIVVKTERLAALQDQRNYIVDSYTGSAEVPTEISSRELEARERSFWIQRQEIVLKNIEDNIKGVVRDSNSLLVNKSGYRVLLINDYHRTASFVIKGTNGGNDVSVTLNPKTKKSVYLVSGEYYAQCFEEARLIGNKTLNITGSLHNYKGEPCFGFVRVSRRY